MLTAIAGLLFSCGGKKNVEEAAANAVDSLAAVVVDEHRANTALDYMGTYKGEIPAADAAGIIVSITLSDSTYVRTMQFVGKKGTSEDKGSYTWNAEGNTITLQGTEAPNQYFVGENTLFQLDIEGKRITGELADKYVLRK